MDFMYALAIVLSIGATCLVLGMVLGSVILLSRIGPAISKHPGKTRWACLAILAFAWILLLKLKFLLSYKSVVWGLAFTVMMWGALSRFCGRWFLWKEPFTLSFWLPDHIASRFAKNGTS